MISRKRWQYYCEHCKKSSGAKWVITDHEPYCIRRIDRKCKLCQESEEVNDITVVVADALTWDCVVEIRRNTEDYMIPEEIYQSQAVKKLEESLNFCADCMLAVMIQLGIQGLIDTQIFDYKARKKEQWQYINNEANINCNYY